MSRDSRSRVVLRWLPSALWMAVIFGFSSLTGSDLSPVSALSTFGHIGEYAILGALLFSAARRTWDVRAAAVFAATAASAYGLTDELHQFLTPGRSPDVRDWAADTAGALLAVACFLLVERLAARRRGLSDA